MAFHQKVFFSIIIPTFDSSSTIKQCLESIFSQSFLFFEVWIIDGGSSDDTIQIVKEYSSKFPNIHWISEKDNGIYDAMNKGIRMARGEWIYFLGSDDKLNTNEVLQKIFDFDKKDFPVIYGNVKLIGDSSWAKNDDIYDGEFDLKKIITKNICHQAIFYKLSYVKLQIGVYNIDYKICADWDFNLRCWANKSFLYINLIVADFYGGGATSKIENSDHVFYKDYKKNLLAYFGKKKLENLLSPSDSLLIGIVSKKSLRKRIRAGIKRLLIKEFGSIKSLKL